MTYEQAQQELKVILHDLQQQLVTIDELSKKSRRAMELIVFCKEKLRSVELEVGEMYDKNE